MKTDKTYITLSLIAVLLINANTASADIKADTDTILDWTERTFPADLPSHQPTKEFNNWLYREYLKTDLYTGINTLDNGVYYIYGANLRAGGQPIFYNTIANLLPKASLPAPACDGSQLPAGFTMTQNGNQVKVSTNGCIPEPNDDPNYCPQVPSANGISILSTINTTVTITGQTNSDTNTDKLCVKNLLPSSAIPTITLDLCYIVDNKEQRTKGTITAQKVDDCFKTDAVYVSDPITQDVWFNTGEGFLLAPR